MEKVIIIVLSMLIIILYNCLKKQKKQLIFYKEDVLKQIDLISKQRKEMKRLEDNERINEVSTKNIINAIEFYSKIDNAKFIRFMEIKHTRLTEIKQKIAIVVYEDNIIYRKEYFKDLIIPAEYKNDMHYKNTINLEFAVFVDGDTDYPLLLSSIYGDKNETIEIEDINLNTRTGRGIGTCIINILNEVLPNYNIRKIKAKVSTVDYNSKEDLMKFYCEKNSFKIVRELTENEWGLLVKEI